MNKLAWNAALPVFIFVWSAAWILSRHFPYLPMSYDSPYYLISAKGFATGAYYKDFSSPDTGAGALLGPSFYPLLLSFYWRCHNPSLFGLQMVNILAMALGPVGSYFWLRLWLSKPLAALLSLAFGSSYMFIVVGNSFMTEVVFTFMLYFGMWLTHRNLPMVWASLRVEKGNEVKPKPIFSFSRLELGLAMVIWVAVARTRVVGWILFFTFILFAARARRWKTVLAGIALVSTWVAWERAMAIGVPVSKYTDKMFTKTYPILVDFQLGLQLWADNVWQNIKGFTTSIDAHILFPYLHDLFVMDLAKRLVCLGVFLWSLWGLWLAWQRWQPLRPWLVAAVFASLPTFLIFTTNDSFRYHLPYFPFLALFFMTPIIILSERMTYSLKSWIPIGAGVILVLSQSLHAIGHDFDTEFFTEPREFRAMHDSLLAMPERPDICLSPNTYYTYLLTGLHSLHLQGRHELGYVRELSMHKVVWAICGPTNEYFCKDWERQGVVFENPPVKQSGSWRLQRVTGWPEKAKDQ